MEMRKETLVAYREKAGYTQTEVARKIGVDRSAVAKWETGASKPRVERLFKLARLYGCTADDLVTKTTITAGQ